jgi:hypothetical protein
VKDITDLAFAPVITRQPFHIYLQVIHQNLLGYITRTSGNLAVSYPLFPSALSHKNIYPQAPFLRGFGGSSQGIEGEEAAFSIILL